MTRTVGAIFTSARAAVMNRIPWMGAQFRIRALAGVNVNADGSAYFHDSSSTKDGSRDVADHHGE